MKKLFLIRHAKSSWDHPDVPDFERPLNKRGKRDAPFMGNLLFKQKIKPDAIITSPAVRALTTAEIFAKELGYPKKKIIRDENMYECGLGDLEDIVQSISDDFSTVLLFGHNPAITSYSNHLGNRYIDGLPTCAIVGIELNVDKWKKAERDKGNVFLFEYPKKYFR